MTYNMTDEDWAQLSNEDVLELSDANIKFGRRLEAEMARRGLITEGP
jgi:hypothetical protein